MSTPWMAVSRVGELERDGGVSLSFRFTSDILWPMISRGHSCTRMSTPWMAARRERCRVLVPDEGAERRGGKGGGEDASLLHVLRGFGGGGGRGGGRAGGRSAERE